MIVYIYNYVGMRRMKFKDCIIKALLKYVFIIFHVDVKLLIEVFYENYWNFL